MRKISWSHCFILMVALVACKKEAKPEQLKIERFDTELYQILKNPGSTSAEVKFLKKYHDFLPLYLSGILHAPQAGRMQTMVALHSFFSDSTLMKVYADEQCRFKDLSAIEKTLGEAVGRYKELFPKSPLPKFRMHLSGLSQSVITVGDCVSIAGDKYLGKDYPLYKGYFYDYQLADMQSDRIVVDALKAYLFGKFPLTNQQNLLDLMVYQGKIHYLLSLLLRDAKPEQLFGYSSRQWEWLTKSEKVAWLYMADNQHLYSTDPVLEAKYTGEAPFTPFFGEASPAKVGVWMGYRIVESYMEKQDIPVSDLFQQTDGKTILQESGYQP